MEITKLKCVWKTRHARSHRVSPEGCIAQHSDARFVCFSARSIVSASSLPPGMDRYKRRPLDLLKSPKETDAQPWVPRLLNSSHSSTSVVYHCSRSIACYTFKHATLADRHLRLGDSKRGAVRSLHWKAQRCLSTSRPDDRCKQCPKRNTHRDQWKWTEQSVSLFLKGEYLRLYKHLAEWECPHLA